MPTGSKQRHRGLQRTHRWRRHAKVSERVSVALFSWPRASVADLVLLDEWKARRVARDAGLSVVVVWEYLRWVPEGALSRT